MKHSPEPRVNDPAEQANPMSPREMYIAGYDTLRQLINERIIKQRLDPDARSQIKAVFEALSNPMDASSYCIAIDGLYGLVKDRLILPPPDGTAERDEFLTAVGRLSGVRNHLLANPSLFTERH